MGKSNPLVTFYLLAYNLGCAGGWAFCLYLLFSNKDNSLEKIRENVFPTLKIVQTFAVLEIVHAMLRLVRSPVFTTLMQVASRLVVVWIYMNYNFGLGFVMAATSWSLVEVPRYLFYAFNLLTEVPYALFWLRYSLFAILYPTGISGELLCLWTTLVALKKEMAYSITDPLFLLYAVSILVLGSYVPGSPFMYGHMVKQRKTSFKKRADQAKKQD